MKQKSLAIAMGIVCFALAMVIAIQLKTMRSANSVVSQTFVDNELRDSVLKWKEKYDKTLVDLEQSEKDLENIRELSTKDNDELQEVQNQIKKNNVLLGNTDVQGPGVVITVRDANNVLSERDSLNSYLIHDGDLRDIVNELNNAGAEAISINGQRVVNSTAITCEGNVIKVNSEKIGSPFTIEAIGSQDLLYGLNRIGGILSQLKEYGRNVDIKKANNVKIPKYSNVITPKYMRNNTK